MFDYSQFESTSWLAKSMQERISALQGFEDEMAMEQGRPARMIVAEQMPKSEMGYYSSDKPNSIYINTLLISENSCYWAMETVAHEGRHAYQDDCVTGKITPSAADIGTVEVWSHNMPGRGGAYLGSGFDFVDYRFQPIEIDANDFSKRKLESLSQHFKNDSAYLTFCKERQDWDDLDIKAANKRYGKNYEQVIMGIVEEKYNKLHMQSHGTISAPRLSDFSSNPEMTRAITGKNIAEVPRQQKLSDVSRDNLLGKSVQSNSRREEKPVASAPKQQKPQTR